MSAPVLSSAQRHTLAVLVVSASLPKEVAPSDYMRQIGKLWSDLQSRRSTPTPAAFEQAMIRLFNTLTPAIARAEKAKAERYVQLAKANLYLEAAFDLATEMGAIAR